MGERTQTGDSLGWKKRTARMRESPAAIARRERIQAHFILLGGGEGVLVLVGVEGRCWSLVVHSSLPATVFTCSLLRGTYQSLFCLVQESLFHLDTMILEHFGYQCFCLTFLPLYKVDNGSNTAYLVLLKCMILFLFS